MKIINVALAINKYILVEVLKTKIEILIKQKMYFDSCYIEIKQLINDKSI